MPAIGIFANNPPNAIGKRSSGSKSFAMASQKRRKVTSIIIIRPRPLLKSLIGLPVALISSARGCTNATIPVDFKKLITISPIG